METMSQPRVGEALEEPSSASASASASEEGLSSEEEGVGLDGPGLDSPGKTEAEAAALEAEGWTDVLGTRQLFKKTLEEGEAEEDLKPKRGDLAEISLRGVVEGSGAVVEEEKELSVWVGLFDVVQGLDIALQLMKLGERAELKLGPRFAYGEVGLAPHVSSEDWLHYTVQLHSVRTGPDMGALSLAELKPILERRRERGNFFYALAEYEVAIQLYEKVEAQTKEALDGGTLTEEERAEVARETALTASNNLAAAALKVEDWAGAVAAADRCLAADPANEKALFRKARGLEGLGRGREAAGLLATALARGGAEEREGPGAGPGLLRRELGRLRAVLGREAAAERRLYSRMLAGSGPAGPSKGRSLSRRLTRAAAFLAALVACAAAVLAALPTLFPHTFPV